MLACFLILDVQVRHEQPPIQTHDIYFEYQNPRRIDVIRDFIRRLTKGYGKFFVVGQIHPTRDAAGPGLELVGEQATGLDALLITAPRLRGIACYSLCDLLPDSLDMGSTF